MEKVLSSVQEEFPLRSYLRPDCTQIYEEVADVCTNLLPANAKILDFGAGACDKSAIAARLGLQCVAYDDYGDPWHKDGSTLSTVLEYAESLGIKLADTMDAALVPDEYDMVMLNHILEHLPDSPRRLLLRILGSLRAEGLLLITVPNAVNLRKRLAVMRGKTNYPDYRTYFLSPPPWRGHTREYTKGDLNALVELLHLDALELRSTHHMLDRLPLTWRRPYRLLSHLAPGTRDSWFLLAKKPADWHVDGLPGEELTGWDA